MPSQPGPHNCPEHSYQIELILILVFDTSRFQQGLIQRQIGNNACASFYQTNKQTNTDKLPRSSPRQDKLRLWTLFFFFFNKD